MLILKKDNMKNANFEERYIERNIDANFEERYIERNIEKQLISWLDAREILLIRGPRQSGKTTILNRLIEILKNRKVEEGKIHLINFEDSMLRIEFEKDPKEFIESYLEGGKNYFLMDEVQYIQDVGKKLKLIFDSFNNVKMIITGSSSFDMTNLGKYLVGRVIFFELYPFSFSEFLRAKNERLEKIHEQIKIDINKKTVIKKSIFIERLNALLHEYLTFGSYPRVVLENDKNKKKELLKNLFLNYIEKDVVSLYGNKYRDKTVKLLKVLASCKSIIKYETLTVNSNLKYKDVTELLPLLQDSFVISILSPFYKNLLNELRKNPKIYFVDYGVRNYLLGNFENIDFDFLYENFIHNELKREHKINFWRTTAKTEVDFIINEKIPIEVKIKPKITRSLRSFIHKYKIKKAFIANLKTIDKKKINNSEIYFCPFVYF
jgi:hypothetical protein